MTDSDKLELYRQRVFELEGELEHHGFRRCDIAACNCGRYHDHRTHRLVDDLKDRIETLEAVRDAANSYSRVVSIDNLNRLCATLNTADAAKEPTVEPTKCPGGGLTRE